MKTISNVLKEIRLEKGMSVGTLTYKTKLGNGYIGKIESGQRSPSIVTLIAIAQALGVKTSEIFLRMENENEV